MQKNNIVSFAVALALLTALSLGCGSLQKIKDRMAEVEREKLEQPGSDLPFGDTQKTDSGNLLAKTNLYISKCFNNYSLRVIDSHRRYTSWIKDPKQGPTGKERIVYGLYEPNGDGADCASAIEEAKLMEPSIPEIEEVADRFSGSLTETVAQIKGIYGYYDQEDYKDDNFQKGKDAHAGLIAAFEKFEGVNKEFAAQIDILENKVALAQLEEFRGDPAREYEFATTEFKIAAKKMMAYVRDQEYSKMSADEIQPLIDEIETKYGEVKTRNPTNPGGGVWMHSGDEFIKAAKSLMRRLRDKKPFTDFDRRAMGTNAGWMIEGSPDQVIDRYNKLIRGF